MAVDPVSLAVTAALTAANMAVTAMQTIEGPRITDTKATVADYGTPLNYFLGTRLMSCPAFFAKPIREKKKKRKGKAGKQVTYTGYGTWAVSIADHEIGGVLQVWFDNHLVYDATGSSVKIYPLADDYDLEAAMRVYLGTEDQEPDPDMLAFIEARDGAGTCPAYRGTSYIYFENIPLEMLGNRYPDVKVLAHQGAALTVAPDSGIEFVGRMGASAVDAGATGDVSFALTNGIATTPAAGDLVLIIVSSSLHPVGSAGEMSPTVSPGYTQLFPSIEVTGGDLANMGLAVWYKFMGETPDATWSSPGNGDADGSVAYLVAVFRGVDPENMLASTVETNSSASATSTAPPDINIGSAIIDPGTIQTSSFPRVSASASFALKCATDDTVLPMAVAGVCLDDAFGVGNFTTAYRRDANGARSPSAAIVFGQTVKVGQGATLEDLLTFVAERSPGAEDYDFSLATQEFSGYNWSQGTGRQVCEAMCDLFDVDLRPHGFSFQALPRGSSSTGSLPAGEFVAQDGAPFMLTRGSEGDLPKRAFLTFADATAEQSPNVAMPSVPTGIGSEPSIDMQTLALEPTEAQRLAERWIRRKRFGRVSSEFGLTRQRLAIEPGDVWAPSFDGDAMVMRCKKTVVGADGKITTEWERDDPAIANLSGSLGAGAAGYVENTVPDAVDTEGFVIDTAYLVDAHDQSAPLAYLAAGPAEPGTWTGADYAISDTGDLDSYSLAWDGIAAGDGAVIGTCGGALQSALPWLFDGGSSVSVTINAGELTAATLDELLLDGTRNLAAIESGAGWELVQFTTATLTAPYTYTISGFLRGVRGTEWAIAGHAPSDKFVLLDTAKRHTLGASEIGDTDYYIVSTAGQAANENDAFSIAFIGASHKPYAPVHAIVEQSGADWVFNATRRTRLGGTTLDGQDVPLGEASESWALDIMDGATVKRTITATSLPLTYTEADQITDWGSAQDSITANLYQVNPTLSLRGYPLAIAA